jgi:Carboxypeptidase regulatory-like domain
MIARQTVAAAIFVLGIASVGADAQSSTATNSEPPASATGTVIGPDSKPQPGVPVQVNGPNGRTTVFTDANGKWSLYNLAPGTYQVQPGPGVTMTNQAPMNFTIDKSGLFGSTPTYNTSVMKLDKEWGVNSAPVSMH